MDNELRAECAAAAQAARHAASRAPLQPRHAALGLPAVQGAHHGAAEHPGGELAGAARQMRAAARTRSARVIRWWNSPTGVLSGFIAWQFGFGLAARGRAGVHLVPDRADDDRLRHAVPARLAHLPAAVARPAGEPLASGLGRRRALPVGPRDSHHRRGRRLSQPVERVLAVQAAHRQGRHGLRRLQAAGRARRLARLADAAAHHRVRLGRRRGVRRCAS